MIEKLTLPNRLRDLAGGGNALRGPLFELTHEMRDRRRLTGAGCAEEVHVVRHEDETPYAPSPAFLCLLQFVEQNLRNLGLGEQRAAIGRACGDEIERSVREGSVKPLQMIVARIWHTPIVVAIGDWGYSRARGNCSRGP